MTPDFQRRIQRYGWDNAAGYYDSYWQRQLKPAQNWLLKRAALQSGEHVLEVACGSGLVTFPAAEAVAPNGTVTATDLSDGMLERARRIASERGIRNVTFERMDAEALNLPDGVPGSPAFAGTGSSGVGFDAALCSLGLMYVPDPVQALREMHRVLRPGGRAATVVWGARKHCGWAEVFPIVDRRVKSDVCPLFFQLGTGDALEAAFHTAGFKDLHVERFSVKLRYATPEDACTAAFWGGAVALAWRKFDDATRAAANEEYLASIEPYRNGSGYAIPGEFVVASGWRTGVRVTTETQ